MEIALLTFFGIIVFAILMSSYYGELSSLLANNRKSSVTKELDTDFIQKVGIDESSRLIVRPASRKFPYIYREAMEVHWCEKGCFLYSPAPKDWSYLDWYKQIIKSAELQSVHLHINDETVWSYVPDDLKLKILEFNNEKVHQQK